MPNTYIKMQDKAITNFLPITPGQRFTRLLKRNHLLKVDRIKKKCVPNKNSSGRNHSGQITVRHRGAGVKHAYRILDIDHKLSNGLVQGYEYDPNRNPNISRLFNPDTHSHIYTLGVKDVSRGKVLRSYNAAKLQDGHSLCLSSIPAGYVLHNLSTSKEKKGQYLRSAGAYGQLLQKANNYARIKLRSGEHKLFSLMGTATLGSVCDEGYRQINHGKAGRRRYLGFRPRVRGVAINPVDHPHGGGEGKTSGGRPSVTPWGKPTKGQPTVPKNKKNRI